MTQNGGGLWCRNATRSGSVIARTLPETSGNHTMMSVAAVSPQIRDEFLRLWPFRPTRVRTATLRGDGLIPWHPLPRLHAGIADATFDPAKSTPEEYDSFLEQNRDHGARLKNERSWWRSVRELQRFVPNSA